MAQVGVLVTWREVTGSMPSMALLEERLAPYRLTAVLLGLARLAGLLKTWQNRPNFDVDRLLAQQLLPTYYPAIRRACEASPNRVTFARVGLLFLAKQACAICELEGREIEPGQDVETVFSTCLLANDLLLGRLPNSVDTNLDKATNLLPFANYVPRNSYTTDLARNLLLLEEIAPGFRGRADYIDIAELFTGATGISVRQFCELAFAASVKFITNVETQLREPATAFLLTAEYFRHTAIPPDDLANCLTRLTTSVAALRVDAQRPGTLGADFLLFQRRPLVESDKDRYLCPDPGFLLDKAGLSLYWTLHEATPRDRQHALLTHWSGLIEEYVHWLFKQTYQGRGHFLPSPRFSNGDEAADGCLIEGSSLVLVEIKGSILTAQAKYGFDPATLREELHRKAITGEDNERKGVAQLRHNLERFLDGDDIAGIDRTAVRTIYPVLVFLDHGFTAPYMNLVYNEHFDSAYLRRRYRRTITKLFSVTVEDLENTLPHTHRHALNEILESYYRANRNMYGELSHSSVPLLVRESPGLDVVRARFERFGEELERRFFPAHSTEL